MLPSVENEAGPSTGTRSLNSRSPVKAAPARASRSRQPLPTAKTMATAEVGAPAHRVSSPSTTSSHTVTSGPAAEEPGARASNSKSGIARPRRTYSRQPRTMTPVPPSAPIPALLPSPSLLHPSYTHTPRSPAYSTHSRSSSPLSSPAKTPVKSSPLPRMPAAQKGKVRAAPATVPRAERKPANLARAPRGAANMSTAEKRVLPARIRRAAGTGAEGIRDLEEMVVDWLERWGEPLDTPPDSLVIHATTLPLSYIDFPNPAKAETSPPLALDPPFDPPHSFEEPAQPRQTIEVPSWHKVKPGEDDEEEAKDELQTLRFTQRLGRGNTSPVKRLRNATAETPLEDTSDAYYIALHKKYEVFERRQRIREKETLQFERYKMRSRIDLLRGMSKTAWSAVVAVVLSRSAIGPAAPVIKRVLKMGEVEKEPEVVPPKKGEEGLQFDRWARGRLKIELEGPDWLRDRLVTEGEELMRRYDELLPPDHRKSRVKDMSPAPTTSYSPSLSPPPVIPHRIAALREPASTSAHRQRTQPTTTSTSTPRRITLTLKARSAPARPVIDSAPTGDESMRKRKRPTSLAGQSDRHTRSKNERPQAVANEERRKSLRSSTPLAADAEDEDEVGMGDDERDEEEPGMLEKEQQSAKQSTRHSEFRKNPMEIEADGPPPLKRTISIIKLASAPISIRISRSSGTPTINASPRIAVGPGADGPSGGTRSSRAAKPDLLVPNGEKVDSVDSSDKTQGNSSPDEAKELHEVEAAVL